MEKPFIIANKEMKDDIADAINKHINNIPADLIADFLEKLVINLRAIATKQYEDAVKNYTNEPNEHSELEREATLRHFNETIKQSTTE